MAEEKVMNKQPVNNEKMDAGSKHLSDALRISFIVLKLIMLVLVIAFLLSGFKTVDSGERALVLRFGKIRGQGADRILTPGAHWTLPAPVDEIVKISVTEKITMRLNSFWYHQGKSELLGKDARVRPTLNPVIDGYSLARSEENTTTGTGSDYNIVHSKWVVEYHIDDPERVFKNITLKKPAPGQSYNDIISESLTPFMKSLAEDCIVTTMVNYTIEEVIKTQEKIPGAVKVRLQKKLNDIESGIKVDKVQLAMDKPWPRQVNDAFLKSISARQDREKQIKNAQTYADRVISETGGVLAGELLDKLQDESLTAEQQEEIWSQFSGEVHTILSEARTYKTSVVETAKANADYFSKILPEYRKRPQLVLQKIYQDTIEEVLNNTEEKMIIQPSNSSKGKEVRVLIKSENSRKESQNNQSN